MVWQPSSPPPPPPLSSPLSHSWCSSRWSTWKIVTIHRRESSKKKYLESEVWLKCWDPDLSCSKLVGETDCQWPNKLGKGAKGWEKEFNPTGRDEKGWPASGDNTNTNTTWSIKRLTCEWWRSHPQSPQFCPHRPHSIQFRILKPILY